ncbi:hypothetical protein BH09PSE2_BH09PSE2_15150 [soil metagenome]
MAYAVDPRALQPGNPSEFAPNYRPGTPAPYSGIYKCQTCGREAVSTKGHPLPPQHLAHNHPLPIAWKLLVAATHI